MSGTTVVGSSVRESLDDATNVLLLTGSMDARDDEGCALCLDLGQASRENVLCVTYTGSPDDRLDAWRTHSTGMPANVGFVDVSDPSRSVASSGPDRMSVPGEPISISSVSNPADMTRVGIEVSEYLDRWADEGTSIRFCFHSLSALLQYVELEPAFQFLHVLTGRLSAVDAKAHFHLDPNACDERTINALKGLFETAMIEEPDGTWTISSR